MLSARQPTLARAYWGRQIQHILLKPFLAKNLVHKTVDKQESTKNGVHHTAGQSKLSIEIKP